MMRLARLSVAAGTLAFLFACTGDGVAPPIGGPSFAVSDGANNDGNPDFFFLPPLVKNPSSDPHFEPTAFNPNVKPVVEICELTASFTCVDPPLRRFETAELSLAGQHYQVNWNTDEFKLDLTKYYRITVIVGTTELGFADVDPVSSGRDLKNAQTGEYIGLVDGRTLPIKFRIENRALCIQDGCGAAASATINLAEGGGVVLEAQGEVFKLDIPPGTTALSGGQPVTDVTFNLEVCPDEIDVDLPRFGKCLRVTTFFGTDGPQAPLLLTNPAFSNPALISMCLLEPGLPPSQEDLITLHQQDGVRIRALPHAGPNCDVIGARAQESPGLAARGWRWIRDIAGKLLTPRPLYARSRTAVFNLGGGGETDRFGAECSSPAPVAKQMLLAECPAAVAPQLAAPAAVAVTGSTVSDFQFALPAQMDPLPGTGGQTAAPGSPVATPPGVRVTDAHGGWVANATVHFEVTAGNGSVTPLTVTSTSEGIAQVTAWVLGDAGTNTVRAFGFGIAGPDDPGPFMPNIALPPTPTAPRCVPDVPCQQAVELATGEVEFTATGISPMGSLAFIQQPTNTVSGEAISPALQIRVLDPSGEPLGEIVRVTVGNDPNNPETCQVLQTSQLALDGVATFSNVIVNGTCTGARVAATAGGGDFDFPIIVSEPFDILPASVTGLLLRYQFDGNANNTGLLEGYNGTATSVTYPEGRFGQAIKFDGTAATGATLTGTAGVFATGSDWTISLWFKEDVKNALVDLWTFRGPARGWETYHGVPEPGQRMITCSDGGCLSFFSDAGVWHNIIYRYDGVSPTVGAPVEIYVDGVLAGQLDNAGAIPLVSSGVIDIRLGPSQFYVDEFRVYNQVFTVAQQCTDVIGGTWTGESCTMP